MNGKILKEGITFDDVLLIPAKSDVLPNEVSLKTRLTKKITLNLPILSAAMDTVTESDLAIALARQGGIGFIHKNMSIEEQAAEVDRVKRSESGMITNPITLNKDSRVYQAEELMSRYKISGLPVIENDGKLIGIITNRDIKYRKDLDQPVGDIMTSKGLITAPVGTTLEQAKEILLANRIEKLPITDQNGYLKGLITIKDIDNKINYPNLRYKEYKFLEEYKYKPISGEITSKYEDIKTYHYNATTNPGPLAIGDNPPINNFYGGMDNNASNESGMFVRMGDETYPYGSWYTKVPKNSEVEARVDLAIKKWWVDSNGEIKIRGFEVDKSILDTIYYIEFPEGIPKYKGPVGYQGGPFLGGLNQEQYFIPNSKNFGKVIKSYPVK